MNFNTIFANAVNMTLQGKIGGANIGPESTSRSR